MPNYKRAHYGRTYFFTVVTYKRAPIFREKSAIDLLRSVTRDVRSLRPFDIDAMVVLPEHLHCIWTLPEEDIDYSKRWGMIKAAFTKNLQNGHGSINPQNASRIKRHEAENWQRRFWEHQIRDDHDYQSHCDYIHYNPVKHGLASRPSEWAWSSFGNAVKKGWYDESWGDHEPATIVGMDCE